MGLRGVGEWIGRPQAKKIREGGVRLVGLLGGREEKSGKGEERSLGFSEK